MPEETPVALVYDGTTHAVLMATPADLEDMAIGFSLTEGIVTHRDQIEDLSVVPQADGVELRIWLASDPARNFSERRRAIIGPSGCGLCGVESLAEAVRKPGTVDSGLAVTHDEVAGAIKMLRNMQPLGTLTRAVHAAGFWTRAKGIVHVREDVGRHNALDKLAGALARSGHGGRDGMVLLTSRVSVEMVQKTARIGASILVAVSAPTALAIRTAEAAGMTMIAVARDDGFEIFCGGHRVMA